MDPLINYLLRSLKAIARAVHGQLTASALTFSSKEDILSRLIRADVVADAGGETFSINLESTVNKEGIVRVTLETVNRIIRSTWSEGLVDFVDLCSTYLTFETQTMFDPTKYDNQGRTLDPLPECAGRFTNAFELAQFTPCEVNGREFRDLVIDVEKERKILREEKKIKMEAYKQTQYFGATVLIFQK